MKKNSLKPDAVLKDYWRNNDRFADLFNQVFFDGKNILTSEALTDKDTEVSAVIMEKDKTVSSITRARDLIKQYGDGIDLVLIGLENQMRIDYGIPVRTMLYEALDYTKQCKELEQSHRKNKDLEGADQFLSGISSQDKINAVVTLVVYYGEKSWDGPMCIGDMVNVPEPFRPLFNNHNIHLLCVNNANEYHFRNKDNQDFFTLLDLLYNKSGVDINSFKEKFPDLDVYWETLAALGAATGSGELVDYAFRNEGGRIRMCTALESLKKEGMIEGKREGKIEGKKEGKREGKIEGILGAMEILKDLGLTEEEICQRIQKQYHLDKETVMSYFL